MKIEVGSVVRLRSGSPPLTVMTLRDDGVAHVVWFTNTNEMNSDAFPVASLCHEADYSAECMMAADAANGVE